MQPIQTQSTVLHEPQKSGEGKTTELNMDRQSRQAETNKATLQAHMDVSIGSKNKPMSLVYKAALEAINEELKSIHGEDAAQKINDQGIDVSPEATAKRIVDISTGFFNSYQDIHKDQDLEEQVDGFLDLLRQGVETGFGEAREILDGLGVLEGDLEADINQTYNLVMEGYDDFKSSMLELDDQE